MNQAARTILDDNVLGSAATVNHDGSPWVTPLHFVADDTHVYWFSHEAAQHSENIAKNSQVSVAIFSPDESSGLQGVYINGQAEKAASRDTTERVQTLYAQKTGMLPKIFETFSVYRLEIGQCSEEKSTGNCWYFYS